MTKSKLLDSLNQMLDDAEAGTFSPEHYDESKLSAIECRMKDFLDGTLVKTDRLSAEHDAVKSLISDISHQTKTPLANLRLYAELLKEQSLPNDAARLTDELLTQTEKLTFLIETLVELSRLETGMLTLHPVTSEIAPLLAAVRNAFREKAAEKQLMLTADEAPIGNLTAIFDPKWTLEALSNVVDNAVKYTPAGGVVMLSVTPYEFFVRIDVTNTGTSIPEGLPIFDRFTRGADVSNEPGVGLGLFLTREILSREGAYVKVASKNERTTFSLFLPKSRI